MVLHVRKATNLSGDFSKALGDSLDTILKSKLDQRMQQQKMAQLQSLIGGGPAPQQDQGIPVEEGFASPAQQGVEPGQEEVRQEIDLTQDVPSHKFVPHTKAFSPEQILGVNAIDPQAAKLMQSQNDVRSREEASRWKETKETRKTVNGQARAAHENNLRLDRMQALNDKGDLVSGVYNKALEKFGLDIGILKTPDSEEFEKLSNDMFKGIREIFGNRILKIEMITFLKTIPTLMQSEEGKNRVIRNLKTLNQGAFLRKKAMSRIIKENGGSPPYDLETQIDERIGPGLEKIGEQFKQGQESVSGQQFESLPTASQFSGKTIKDSNTGKRYRSDGKKWKVVK